MSKHIHVVINPAAGQQEPILSYLNHAWRKKDVSWDVSITHKSGDGLIRAKEAIDKGAQIICAYGGDGTVNEVAQAVYTTNIPMAIIPGGTANIIAKELAIPANSMDAVALVTSKEQTITKIDMGKCNDTLFLIRVSVGVLAHPVIDASRDLKNTYGKLAYGITTLKHIGKPTKTKYSLILDGKRVTATGASLIITNIGNVGIEGFSLSPTISTTDGKFDIIRFKDTNLSTLAALATNVLFKTEPDKVVRLWQAKKIEITLPNKQQVLVDDVVLQEKKLSIEVLPKSINIIVPK
jgi:YegS/Rv2252/BmrU family lipid kinase